MTIICTSTMLFTCVIIAAIQSYAAASDPPVFLSSDRSLNPFSDPFIQRFMSMDRSQLYAMPPMSDADFLAALSSNDDTLGGALSRSEVDPYEAIFDEKRDDQLALQADIDGEWVELMTAGPLTVNYIANLLVLASNRDFPLTRPPYYVFQHIKDPNSFRATIAQISGSMYSALIGAHVAMDRIQLSVQPVPGHVKTALMLVAVGSPMLIEVMLPKTLESIGRIANESAAQARATFDKFSSLQELMAEIIEASTNTHSSQTAVVQQIQTQINQAKEEQKNLNNNIHSITSQYDEARREVEKARQEYQTAYNAIPTARKFLKKVFRAVVHAVVSVITTPINVISGLFGKNQAAAAAAAAAQLAAETAKQNAIAKANHLLEVLKEAEKRQQAFAQQQAVEQEKLVAIINKIAKLDLDRMSEQEIVDILIESILQMNEIKVQWGRLVQFFSKLSVQADSTQQIIIHELIAVIKDAQAHGVLMEPSDRELFAEILSVTCQEIERGAHLLYVMSKTYYDISSEHMIGQINTINTLMYIGNAADRSAYLKSLASNTTTTSERIKTLAQTRQNEYALGNQARQKEYEKFLAKLELEDLDILIG